MPETTKDVPWNRGRGNP